MPDFPMKAWNVKLFLLDQDGNKHPATCFNKVVYNLHPSFDNPQQSESAHSIPYRHYCEIPLTPAMLTLSPAVSLPRGSLHLL